MRMTTIAEKLRKKGLDKALKQITNEGTERLKVF